MDPSLSSVSANVNLGILSQKTETYSLQVEPEFLLRIWPVFQLDFFSLNNMMDRLMHVSVKQPRY